MKVLFIANARWKQGMSGSDNIYRMFIQHWNIDDRWSDLWTMMDIDFKPFWLCYSVRIILSILRALRCKEEYDCVYSCSDFMMDSIPALIMKKRGKAKKWVAGFYMIAPKDNKIYFYTQKIVKRIIDKFADIVILTNTSMYHVFQNKKKTWINGGVDLSLAGIDYRTKIFDCVFCGRIHPTKGVDELVDIWEMVREDRENATLAIIGDGDLGKEYLKEKMKERYGDLEGISFFGHLGDVRFNVFKNSKIVLYPVPQKYDHFSMAPVEAMACGCPMVAFYTKSMRTMCPDGSDFLADSSEDFAVAIDLMLKEDRYKDSREDACEWAMQFDEKKQADRVFDFLKENL